MTNNINNIVSELSDERLSKSMQQIQQYTGLSQSILHKMTGGDPEIQREIFKAMPQQYLWMFGSNFTNRGEHYDCDVYDYDLHPLAESRGVRGDFSALIPINISESDRDIARNLRKIITNSRRISLMNRIEKLEKRINNCNNDNFILWTEQLRLIRREYARSYSKTISYDKN